MSLSDLLGIEREIFSTKYDGHKISITEKNGARTLKCDDLIYSRINKNSLYTHEYWDFFIPLIYLYPKPRILMIGLGGGTIAFQFSKLLGNKLSLDIVELDSRMASVYPKFLGTETGYKIIIKDGAEYVAGLSKEYDIVILDAYEPRGNIPEQFLQEKFISDAYNATTEDGIFAINCIGSMIGPVLDSFIQNLSKKFQVYRIDTSGFTANVVLVCTKRMAKEELLKRIHDNMRLDSKGAFLERAYQSAKRVYLTL